MRKGRPVQGTVRTKPVGPRLGFGGDEYGYALDSGHPVPGRTMFNLDPEFKREALWTGPVLRPAALVAARHANVVRARGDSGAWGDPTKIALTDSMLSELAEPEVLALREEEALAVGMPSMGALHEWMNAVGQPGRPRFARELGLPAHQLRRVGAGAPWGAQPTRE